MSEPCPTCDVIGPDRNAETAVIRDLHRAFHDVWRSLSVAFAPIIEAVREQGERERLVTKNAFVLMNENIAASLRGENGSDQPR